MGVRERVLLESRETGAWRGIAKLCVLAAGSLALGLALSLLWFPLGILPMLAGQLFAMLGGAGLRTALRVTRLFLRDERLISATYYGGIPAWRRAIEVRELEGIVVEEGPGITVGRFGSRLTGERLVRLAAIWRAQRLPLTRWLGPERCSEVEGVAQDLAKSVGAPLQRLETAYALPDNGVLDIVVGVAALFPYGYLVKALWDVLQ